MGIVPMHNWKMPLKYWGVFPSQSWPLRLPESGAHHGQGGGNLQIGGKKIHL